MDDQRPPTMHISLKEWVSILEILQLHMTVHERLIANLQQRMGDVELDVSNMDRWRSNSLPVADCSDDE